MFKKTGVLIKNVGDLKGDLRKLSDTLHTDGWVQRSHFLISKVPFKKVKRVAFQRNFKWNIHTLYMRLFSISLNLEMMKLMLRNMIEHVLFTEIGRIPAKHFTKKSKWSLSISKKYETTNKFFFCNYR